ncbi:hypothetical protein B0P06_002209 [Clostridium saccharoperbutylacetonicum]|uniref:Uncharacterized protein n=1 Tax=Clostridium saccharoperbutylacetonicum N1-4(HMT) TaxID=931276 RepID=M1N7V4_9CLOT|nr:hypothetical protein [Clostridium saccharoperbutylacetonicum]AGF59452.1 hypothetical protein Cspa_c57270 [Clostridium saccharoperbutylacetonicum N1-4(HMT)]NRT59755.1 hypothetical protein [Clostridium saccharoperbutylacetonicum]NSB23067.1 hypothetical protein [Clostridium saccharoperbutylacetonicum]NSB42438.1 hypothetical protein [Clostridium saccharoperbutylacetonicum]
MIKLQIKYKTDDEKNKMISILSAGVTIKKISKESKSGKYYRLYLDIE